MIGKRHPGVLPIEPVTRSAVMGKRYSSVFEMRRGIRQGVLGFLAADRHRVFNPVDGSGLPASRRSGFARCKGSSDAKNQN